MTPRLLCFVSTTSRIERKLSEICDDVFTEHLIPSAQTSESKVFIYKMKGDCHQYLAEFADDKRREETANAYEAVSDVAKVVLQRLR